MTARHHCQPLNAEIGRRLADPVGKARRAGDHVEQDVPLRAKDHQRGQPDVRGRAQPTMTTTANGKSRLAGKAARNCASGCTISATAGRRPIQTPIGTQMTLASAISTTTRSSVMEAEPKARPTRPAVLVAT